MAFVNTARGSRPLLLLLLAFLLLIASVNSFAPPAAGKTTSVVRSPVTLSLLSDEENFDRKVRLREEAESPFRKVRFFFYFNLGGGALVSLFLSATRIAAGLNGINTDLLPESEVNAAVDIIGLVIIGLLFRNDLKAQESRVQRAAKGAALANLQVRVSQQLADELADSERTFMTPLSSFRRGRGMDQRVVICAGGSAKIRQVLQDAERLQEALRMNDLLIVPVELPNAVGPTIDADTKIPACVALPVVGPNGEWKSVIEEEIGEARKQGVDVEEEGISIVLKKNGRVGQRTKGVYLNKMVGEVENRRELGLDVTNI